MYSNKQRQAIRDLQDAIIQEADKRHVNFDMRVSMNMPANITVWSLTGVIYPEYEPELRATLSTLLHKP